MSADAGRAASANPGSGPSPSSYGAGARILSIGIATTGLVTFAFFAVASHVLEEVDYKGISLLWSVLFVVVSVIYRPIEQLLSRSIAEQAALGGSASSLRTPLLLQGAFALAFLAVALPLREPLTEDVFDGSETLYWVLVASVVAYAASYFARGWLAGNRRFGLYGALVLIESTGRFLFPLAVAIGLLEGQGAVAAGILVAPLISLAVVPWALGRRHRASAGEEPGEGPSLRAGGGFAVAVFAVMLAEQTIINAPVLIADATAEDAALAGFVFNALLIARAPLQLFQAIQTSLLPHLASLNATDDAGEFARAIRVTLLAIAGFAGAVALGLLAVGPFAMDLLFGGDFEYGRVGLALVALGMGCHLAAGTLNQAALARGRQGVAAAAWGGAAVLLIVWLALPLVDDELLRVQVGYLGATALLCAALTLVERRPAPVVAPPPPHPPPRGGGSS